MQRAFEAIVFQGLCETVKNSAVVILLHTPWSHQNCLYLGIFQNLCVKQFSREIKIAFLSFLRRVAQPFREDVTIKPY